MFLPSPWGDRRRMRIGLLGGSFNPAHDGHLHISDQAHRRLGLDQVWWLVSPQNPLKSSKGMAPLEKRLSDARKAASAPWIHVTDIERRLDVTLTWQTLTLLRQRFPKADFVWLMGADNMVQIPQWMRWSKIFQLVHVAVFDRSPYSHDALSGQAARRFSHRRLRSSRPLALWQKTRTTWVYVAQRRHSASSTAIRLGDAGK